MNHSLQVHSLNSASNCNKNPQPLCPYLTEKYLLQIIPCSKRNAHKGVWIPCHEENCILITNASNISTLNTISNSPDQGLVLPLEATRCSYNQRLDKQRGVGEPRYTADCIQRTRSRLFSIRWSFWNRADRRRTLRGGSSMVRCTCKCRIAGANSNDVRVHCSLGGTASWILVSPRCNDFPCRLYEPFFGGSFFFHPIPPPPLSPFRLRRRFISQRAEITKTTMRMRTRDESVR